MTTDEAVAIVRELEYKTKALAEENEHLWQNLSKALQPLRRDTYSAAVKTYDRTSRLMLAVEEMSELSKELSKNYRGADNISAISEEMADVEIMLEQLKLIFNNRAEVDTAKSDKLRRLSETLLTVNGGER